MTVRADYISALYEVRDPHAEPGAGRPWRIEAAVVGLPHPVVLATAPDPEDPTEPAFLGGLPELRDEITAELERVHEFKISFGWVKPYVRDQHLGIEWEREQPSRP
jgi:hypothetical protein